MAVYLNGEEVGVIVNSGSTPEPGKTELPEYMSAKNFIFDGNVCTGYVGDNTLPEIIIPKSYSTITSTETVVGAKVLDKENLSMSIYDFQSTTFSDGGTNTQTYTSTSQLQNLSTDFPNDCYLVSMEGSHPFSFDFLRDAFDMQVLQFPIAINGQSFSDGMTAFEYIERNNIIDVNFGGDVEVISYIDGDDYQVTSVSGSNNSSGFKNYQNRIILLSNLTSIGDYAFYGCNSLTSIEIPNSVTSIGEWAFSGCNALTSIDIPSSVTNIGEDAFYRCDKLGNITVDPSNADYYSDEYGVLFNKDKTELIQYPIGNTRTQYTIPDSVTSIGSSAFFYCTSLTSVTIGNNVTSIGISAFFGCDGLTTVTIPDSVTSIEVNAFSSCDSLTSVNFGDNSQLTSIESHAFGSCRGLTSIDLSGCTSLTSIGSSAFEGCSGLTSITLPSSLTSTGYYTFRYCTSLASVTIPDSVTSIGYEAFNGCSGLTSVTIGNGVTSIEGNAFGSCTSLVTVQVNATTPPTIRTNTFDYTVQRYEVPMESVEAYKTANVWSNFADKIVGHTE